VFQGQPRNKEFSKRGKLPQKKMANRKEIPLKEKACQGKGPT